MSAECHKCGTDLVHEPGEWPAMTCPVCDVSYERLTKAMQGLIATFEDRAERDREAALKVEREGTHSPVELWGSWRANENAASLFKQRFRAALPPPSNQSKETL